MTDEDKIADMLLSWEEARERGETITAEELCRDCPELLDAVRERVRLLESAGWLRASSTTAPDTPRTLAGRYSLENLIGSGGYAQVWRAYDLQLHRHVAVKVPKPSRTLTSEQVEEVLTEARQVARLKHPNIVAVHDVVQEGAGYFIVADLIEGQTLAARLEQGRMPIAQAATLLAQVARVIDYAHAQGIVHRDLKPANIFLDHAGQPHVGDFGLARSREDLIDGSDRRGTLAYSSPEQLEGQPLDGRSDIWSLGIIVYELLTGRLPFADDNPVRLRQTILPGAPPALLGIPEPLAKICLRCLAQKPEGRFLSGNDLAAALEAAAGKKSRRRWPAFAALAVVVAVGIAINFIRPVSETGDERVVPSPFAVSLDELIWSNEQSGTICSAELDGSSINPLGVVGTPQGIAVNRLTGQIYWTDYLMKKISRINQDGSERALLIESKTQPRGIAVDVDEGKLFWASFGAGEPSIQSANLDGSAVRTVVSSTTSEGQLNVVIGIALDNIREKIYWTQFEGFAGQPPKERTAVARANYDGTQVEKVTTGSEAFMIAVDPEGGNVYWSQKNHVWIAKLDGSDARILLASPMGGHLRGIALDLPNQQMFVVDYDTNSILRAALNGSGVRTVIVNQSRPTGIAIRRKVSQGKDISR